MSLKGALLQNMCSSLSYCFRV